MTTTAGDGPGCSQELGISAECSMCMTGTQTLGPSSAVSQHVHSQEAVSEEEAGLEARLLVLDADIPSCSLICWPQHPALMVFLILLLAQIFKLEIIRSQLLKQICTQD